MPEEQDMFCDYFWIAIIFKRTPASSHDVPVASTRKSVGVT